MADGKTPHQKAIDRFKTVNRAEADQRAAELSDLEFVDLEQQWSATAKQLRDGIPVAGQQLPERPCLVFNLLKQPVQLLANQQRNAKLSLTFSPKGSGASKDTAEAFEDIARACQAESRADLARNWAYERAIKCGRGFYRLLTEYANDGDDDLDIVYKRILNQASVYFDPYTQEPDFSDARFCFITQDLPFSEYQALFGDTKLAACEDGELVGIGNDLPDWIGGDDEKNRTVRIAEYFYIEEVVESPPPIPVSGATTTQPRSKPQRVVKWCKLNGVEMLEEPREFPGRYIPIVPVIADEYNVNGKRVWQGLVRPSKDGNRSYNYMRSAMVEAIGLAPRAPWIIEEGQIEGREDMWNQSNVRNFPALIYKGTSFSGKPSPPPQRVAVEPPIQAMAIAGNEAKEDVKTTTGVFDPSLGQLSPSERSGKAILALQKQSEMGSSGYLDNLASMSLSLEGKIFRGMAPVVYGRPGRMVSTFGADDQRGAVLIGIPYMMQGGKPVPIAGWQEGMPIPKDAKYIDLAKGEYSVAATVGKSFTTRREEGAAAMTEFAQAAPQMMPMIADLWVGNMDFPGASQIADRLKKMLPPQLQDENADDPAMKLAQMQGEIEKMSQILSMTTKELQARTQQVETEQVQNEADLTRTKLELDSKERIEQMKIEAQLRIEELKAGNQAALAGMQAQIEFLMAEQSAAYARQAQNDQMAYQAAMQGSQQQHEMGQQGAEQGFEAQESEAGRQHEAQLTGAQLEAQQQMAAQQTQEGA